MIDNNINKRLIYKLDDKSCTKLLILDLVTMLLYFDLNNHFLYYFFSFYIRSTLFKKSVFYFLKKTIYIRFGKW